MTPFEYNCPHCNTLMYGSFGDNVYCPKCDLSFETENECSYSDEGDIYGSWLTGKEFKGKVDLDDNFYLNYTTNKTNNGKNY